MPDALEVCGDFRDDMIQDVGTFGQRILKIAIVEYVHVFEQLHNLSLRLLNVDRLGLVLLPLSVLCLLSVLESELF